VPEGTNPMLPMILFTTGYLGFYAQPVAFDCDRASLGVDFVICANRQLMDAESQLEDAYRAAHASGGDEVKLSQREWVRSYGPACGLPARGEPSSAEALRARDCVLNAINKRTAYLKSLAGGADLPSRNDPSTTAANSDVSPPPPATTSPDQQTIANDNIEEPKLNVQFDPDGASAGTFWRVVKLTSRDSRNIIVSRVVINKKFGNSECDLYVNYNNNNLKNYRLSVGDFVAVKSSRACNDPVVVDVYTNVGQKTYESVN
jgi:uncharacterized protein YecT (DUF1311 family)